MEEILTDNKRKKMIIDLIAEARSCGEIGVQAQGVLATFEQNELLKQQNELLTERNELLREQNFILEFVAKRFAKQEKNDYEEMHPYGGYEFDGKNFRSEVIYGIAPKEKVSKSQKSDEKAL